MVKVDCLPTLRFLTEPSSSNSPWPHSGESTLHQISLQEVAKCGALSGQWTPRSLPSTRLTCLLLPCGLWPLPCLCPWPQSWPGCTYIITLPRLTSASVGLSPHFFLHELEGLCELCPILHPTARPSCTHSICLQLLQGWAGVQPQTMPCHSCAHRRMCVKGEAMFPGAIEESGTSPPEGYLGSSRY